MGRKKRKTAGDDLEDDPTAVNPAESSHDDIKGDDIKADETKNQQSSGYAVTSHSGEIVQEDLYVSDGSESGDEDPEGNKIEVVLTGSRMGMMRRGLHQPLAQPKRQWTRAVEESDEKGNTLTPEQKRQLEEEELAKLDPAERAARLLQEKQRKLEEAKELARRRESEENAGRDALLFSKRTAFDIRFDQIEDKPWLRGNGDVSDFFNYGLTEEEWLEYSEQQLIIRQELIDARRQKRKPDPTLVPVTPENLLRKQKDKASGDDEDGSGDGNIDGAMDMNPQEEVVTSMGPERPEGIKTEKERPLNVSEPVGHDIDLPTHIGGAWGPEPRLEQQDGSYAIQHPQYQEHGDKETDERASQPVYHHHRSTDDRTSDYGDTGYKNVDASQHYGHGKNDSNYYGYNNEPAVGGRGHRHREQGSTYPQDYPPSHHTYGEEQTGPGFRRGSGRGAEQYGGRGGRGGAEHYGRGGGGRGGADHYGGGRGGRGGRGQVQLWGRGEPRLSKALL